VSKILRRPMFRGGRVSSYGTGIATGLTNDTPGYKEGGQIGGGAIYGKPMGDRYGFAEPTIDPKQSIIEEVMIEFPDATIEEQMKIVNQRVSSSTSLLDKAGGLGSILKFGGNLALDIPSSIIDTALSVPVNTVGRFFGYNPGMSANKGVEAIKKGIFGDNAEIYDENDPDKDPDANPDVAEFFGINTDAQNTGTRKEEETLKIIEQKNKDNARKLANQKKEIKTNNTINEMYNQKPDSDVIKEYMDMFSEAYGTNKEALNRSRYLELAKFGANILAQPGGQSIGEIVGQAGGPSLQGMTKIEEAENQGQRQLKGLAIQAAMKNMDNPKLKEIMTLSQLTGKVGDAGYVSPAGIVEKMITNASEGRNVSKNRELTMVALDMVESPLAAQQQLEKAGKEISEVTIIKNFDEPGIDLIENEVYVSKKLQGKNHVGKWDGSKFLFPGDDGFL